MRGRWNWGIIRMCVFRVEIAKWACLLGKGSVCASAFFVRSQSIRAHDLSSLLRFSLLFKRSTRFLCIFSSIFWKRSRSSFAARLVRIASTRRWVALEQAIRILRGAHLAFGFLLVLHLLLLGLDGGQGLALGGALLEGRLVRARPEGRLVGMPLLACATHGSVDAVSQAGAGSNVPFLRIPFTAPRSATGASCVSTAVLIFAEGEGASGR